MNLIPFYILAGISFISFGINLAKHGEPDTYNIWTSTISQLVAWSLIIWGIFG